MLARNEVESSGRLSWLNDDAADAAVGSRRPGQNTKIKAANGSLAFKQFVMFVYFLSLSASLPFSLPSILNKKSVAVIFS